MHDGPAAARAPDDAVTGAPAIGVVTVLYGGEDVIDGFFASLAVQTGVTFRLFVIDNNPTEDILDRCRALAAHHGIDAEFVHNGANVGIAAGNNQGIALARRAGCRWVLLANNDTEFGPGTLATLAAAMESGESVAVPKIHLPGPERRLWYAGGAIGRWTSCTPHRGENEPDRGQHDTPGYTGFAPACFLMIDTAVFDRAGVMDPRFFAYYDDTDFMWRVIQAGYRIRYAPSAEVVHLVGGSTGGVVSAFTLYQGNRNRIYFIRKNYRGLRRITALAYVLSTRVPKSFLVPRRVAGRIWAGVADGLRLPLPGDRA